MEHRAKSKDHEEGKKLYALNSMSCAARAVILLITVQILFFIFSPQKAQTQEIAGRKISDLATQLEALERQLVSIDGNSASLRREKNVLSNELGVLKEEEAKPKGFLRRLPGMGMFRRRKIGRLFTRIQELADEMSDLQEKRKPLVEEFIILADKLIEKSNSRIAVLGEAFLSGDHTDSEEDRKQLSELSDLWGLAERTREVRDKYAPGAIEPEDEWSFPLFSEDPAELRMLAAILKDAAASESAKISQLRAEIKEREQRQEHLKRLLKISEERRRREEERAAAGVGLSQLPWDGMSTEQEIEDINELIDELGNRKQKSEEKAERYQRQAEQIDAKLKEKSEHD